MSQWAIRPTFTLSFPHGKEDAIEKFHLAMQRHKGDPLYLVYGEYAEFHLEEHLHRLWSPHLAVYFVSDGEGRSHLVGRFAPRPNVWTVVWIAYLSFFCTIFFAGMFGGSQWWLGELPWGLFIVALAGMLYASLFIASQIGQSLCKDQMDLLRQRLDTILAEATLQSSSSS